MATSDGDLSATLRGGSDVIYDFFCEPCNTDGEHLEAAGFCKTCAVYLCTGCFKAHRRSPTSRTHKLLDAATMPRTTISSKPRDVLTQPCDKHQDKTIEYYCKADGNLCCTVCLNMKHSSCKARAYIPDISAGVTTGKEYKDIATGMDGLVAMVTDETATIIHGEKDNDANRTRAVADIKSGRKEMDKLLDDAEARAIQKVDELHKQNAKKLKSASQTCQTVLSEATTIATDLGEKARTGKNNQLFVEVKMAGCRLPAMEEEISQVKERDIFHYKFDKDNAVHHFMSTLSAMFSVTLTQDGAGINVRHVIDVNVKTEEDRVDCLINGIAALSGDRLVVIDSNNKSAKLIDITRNKVISRLILPSVPHDIIRTETDQVAVALGQERKIQIFTVTDILTMTNTVDLHSIALSSLFYTENIFIVLDQIARAVKKVDMTGRVTGTVYTDNDSDPLFKTPDSITLNSLHDAVYITDSGGNTVTCMTLRGRVIWVCKHAELLKYPLGVAIGRGGDVMVCSQDTDTVQLLSRSGQFLQVLLDRQRGLAPFPEAISVCEDKLWVSSRSIEPEYSNYVKMFQVK